ncbi:MAG: TlpA disulfide reductase family protein [Balneolales bacterium]
MRFLSFLVFAFISITCSPQEAPESFDRAEPYIERQPIHYKYAPKIEIPLTRNEDGSYRVSLQTGSEEIVTLHYLGETYPLLVSANKAIDVYIDRGYFPFRTRVKGFSSELNELYQEYLIKAGSYKEKIIREMTRFRANESNEVLETYKQLIEVSKEYFEHTSFDDFIYKAIGEYLVMALNDIQTKMTTPCYDIEAERQAVLDEAVQLNFFTLKSLNAQRAGIRDFTNAFAGTFGIKDSLDRKYGHDLMDYDVNRLGYEALNKARESVLDYIKDEDAYVHAQMYLVAERIGEAPFDKAEKSYFDFLESYPEYIEFLTGQYEAKKSVQPGEPAVGFSIRDKDGQIHRMEDYKGKFVLLDIWASWCIPCHQEFPHMERLYKKYSRDDFEIIALSIDEDRDAWERTINRYQHEWPQLYDGKGFQQETFNAYQGGGIPFHILINREGKIERNNDIRASFNLEQVMDSLLQNEKYETSELKGSTLKF